MFYSGGEGRAGCLTVKEGWNGKITLPEEFWDGRSWRSLASLLSEVSSDTAERCGETEECELLKSVLTCEGFMQPSVFCEVTF